MSVCTDYSAPFPPVSHGAGLHTLFFNVLGIYSSECSLSVTIFFLLQSIKQRHFPQAVWVLGLPFSCSPPHWHRHASRKRIRSTSEPSLPIFDDTTSISFSASLTPEWRQYLEQYLHPGYSPFILPVLQLRAEGCCVVYFWAMRWREMSPSEAMVQGDTDKGLPHLHPEDSGSTTEVRSTRENVARSPESQQWESNLGVPC